MMCRRNPAHLRNLKLKNAHNRKFSIKVLTIRKGMIEN